MLKLLLVSHTLKMNTTKYELGRPTTKLKTLNIQQIALHTSKFTATKFTKCH